MVGRVCVSSWVAQLDVGVLDFVDWDMAEGVEEAMKSRGKGSTPKP